MFSNPSNATEQFDNNNHDKNNNGNYKVDTPKSSQIDWTNIEKKWINYWDQNKINESNLDLLKQKYFITVAYPYPNSPQHIGHGRTYTLADVHARYYKMKGFNVLF